MFDGTPTLPLENQLPADAYYHLVRTLRLTLPPPPDDSPEALRRRDGAAIARVAALAPADAAEADLAAQFVAASEQWKDCLRLAQATETTPEWRAKCRAQALGMMRQANAALRLLLRMQAARAKQDNTACDRRALTEHVATRLMAQGLAELPATAAGGTKTRSAPPANAEPEPKLARCHDTGPAPALPAAELARLCATDPGLLASAERYAAVYPERAAQIRRTGKLTSDVLYFDPAEAELASALIAGRSPALAAVDLLPISEATGAGPRDPRAPARQPGFPSLVPSSRVERQ